TSHSLKQVDVAVARAAAGRAAAAHRPVRMELGTPPQRPPRHRASRCLVLLWHRAVPPAPKPWPTGCPLAGSLVRSRARRAPGIAQRADPRSERLLSVLRPHGAASAAHLAVPSAPPSRR